MSEQAWSWFAPRDGTKPRRTGTAFSTRALKDFVAEYEGKVCGTVATIIYDDQLAWIGMILVSPSQRGRGIGTQLLKLAVDQLDSRGPLTIKLDATPQGKPMYHKFGFEPEYEIERWMRGSVTSAQPAQREKELDEGGADVESIAAMDCEAFGWNRGSILRSLDRDAPEFTAAIWNGGALAGCTLGRHGLHADQLGPWLAEDRDVARKLLARFINHSAREFLMADCLKTNPFACELLRSAGFEFSRALTRMVRGADYSKRRSELVCAILGPEFG
ncbi:MAG: GNAT family N-acetyltransferase [Terriglobia bacterium]